MGHFKRNGNFKKRLGRKLIAVAMILLGLVFLVDLRIRPIIEKTTAYQSKILATSIINQAVYEEISSEDFDYASLVTVIYDDSKQVSSIESNMVNINRLKALITKNINDAIMSINQHELSFSSGTVTGLHMLYDKGPEIAFTVRPEGYVETALLSVFSDAGINQTLHRIVLEVRTTVSAIIPGYTTSVEINSQFVIAETIIVGNVPDAYTHVISGNSDLIGNINDYNASQY